MCPLAWWRSALCECNSLVVIVDMHTGILISCIAFSCLEHVQQYCCTIFPECQIMPNETHIYLGAAFEINTLSPTVSCLFLINFEMAPLSPYEVGA